MDRDFRYFLLGGVASILFYILVIALFFLFFNDAKHAKRYVPKVSQSIEVSIMQAPKKKRRDEMTKEAKKEAVTAKKKPLVKAKPKPVVREKRVGKPAVASLFSNVKTTEPIGASKAARLANAPKIRYRPENEASTKTTKRARELVRDINLSKPSINISAKSGGQGEVNAYMTKIYELLYASWQPDAIFAGAHATVRMTIASDGNFDFSLLYPSDNQAFNESLIEYLKQLQTKRLPPHKGKRDLVIDVEFKAKE